MNITSVSKINGVDWLSDWLYNKFDIDNNGGLDISEFTIFYREEDVMLRFFLVNQDGDEFLSMEEFLAYWAKCKCLPGNCFWVKILKEYRGVQGSAKPLTSGCENALGKLRQKW